MRKVLKYGVGFLGAIITICGFTLDNAEYFNFVYKIISPGYANATIAADRMYVNNFTLKEGDTGFNEISELIKSTLRTSSGDAIPESRISQMKIIQVKTIKSGIIHVLDPPPRSGDFIELEVSFQNLQPVTGTFSNIKDRIKEMYLTSALFQWKTIIFGTGIELMIIGLFL